MADQRNETLITLTADIVAAHVANNNIAVSDVALLIGNVHGALSGLGPAAMEPEPELKPAVSVRASVKPDHLVCLEDGKKFKMIKRHLATDHGLTPAEYREKWNLPSSYPMVAPNYADERRSLAVKIGLGRKKGEKRPARRRAAAPKGDPAPPSRQPTHPSGSKAAIDAFDPMPHPDRAACSDARACTDAARRNSSWTTISTGRRSPGAAALISMRARPPSS